MTRVVVADANWSARFGGVLLAVLALAGCTLRRTSRRRHRPTCWRWDVRAAAGAAFHGKTCWWPRPGRRRLDSNRIAYTRNR